MRIVGCSIYCVYVVKMVHYDTLFPLKMVSTDLTHFLEALKLHCRAFLRCNRCLHVNMLYNQAVINLVVSSRNQSMYDMEHKSHREQGLG